MGIKEFFKSNQKKIIILLLILSFLVFLPLLIILAIYLIWLFYKKRKSEVKYVYKRPG